MKDAMKLEMKQNQFDLAEKMRENRAISKLRTFLSLQMEEKR